MAVRLAPNGIPESASALFPEYLFPEMDPETHGGVVIERILEGGSWAEINWLFDRYGEERLAAWLRRHGFRLLSRRSFALWSLVLGIGEPEVPDWAREAKALGW